MGTPAGGNLAMDQHPIQGDRGEGGGRGGGGGGDLAILHVLTS